MTHAFEFLKLEDLPPKPRTRGIIEMRGSYYTPVVYPYLKGLLDIADEYIDGFKWAGGSMRLHPVKEVKRINALCHEHDVYVSTGGFVERVIVEGKAAVDRYFAEAKKLGFDMVELSNGLAPIPLEDMLAMVRAVRKLGMKPKPEISFMSGAGAGTHIKDYKPQYKREQDVFAEIDGYLKEGVELMMFESEGITEDLPGGEWRTDLIKKVTDRYGFERFMFEASDPQVFKWYLRNFGPGVNLFIDHSQVIEFQAWRSHLWGDRRIWEGKSVRDR